MTYAALKQYVKEKKPSIDLIRMCKQDTDLIDNIIMLLYQYQSDLEHIQWVINGTLGTK